MKKPKPNQSPKPSGDRIGLRRVDDGAKPDGFEFVHPRSVLSRADDMEEVRAMIAAGEGDIAEDELRWLLADCRLFIEAHQCLGRLALDNNDLELAEAHLRVAWELGEAALPKGRPCRIPSSRRANRPWLEAGRALVDCLRLRKKAKEADALAKRLHALDPAR